MVTHESQIEVSETSPTGQGRLDNVEELLSNAQFLRAVQKSVDEPLLVCGDFNSPSHLDWTVETRGLHGDWVFEWPVTKLLMSAVGLADSYRVVHPNPLAHPGITWSTVEKMSSSGWNWQIPEPQDRIDFIFYRTPELFPNVSFTYSGEKEEVIMPKPYHWLNAYPSDHYAVITVFHYLKKPPFYHLYDTPSEKRVRNTRRRMMTNLY
ncbi:hypothetical protein AB6A40_011267 [Gnathostoma spinigerum]|uniref:Endonuclease/exonuclease/phosphatase domain-containing protein n=1 Tax=Gnathostoma spinigerum TaxID=75299 RepID=A0ABD6EXR2_9BILA